MTLIKEESVCVFSSSLKNNYFYLYSTKLYQGVSFYNYSKTIKMQVLLKNNWKHSKN